MRATALVAATLVALLAWGPARSQELTLRIDESPARSTDPFPPVPVDGLPSANFVRPDAPTAPVAAAPAVPDEPSTIKLDGDCSVFARKQSWETRNDLLGYKDVFGKNSIDWNDADYRKSIEMARSCHGRQVGADTLDGNNWAAMLQFAYDNVLPVGKIARIVDKFGADLHAREAKFPRCPKLLDFKHDDWAWTDTSKDVFGVDFMLMDDGDLDKTVQYANECLLYLPTWALAAKSMRPDESTLVLNDIMDKALLILKRRQDYADATEWPHRQTDLVLTDDAGAAIMPTMTTSAAREMIQRFNRASATKRKFTPETVSTLVRLSDEVLAGNKSAYDKKYALAIQKKVQEMIFRRGD